MSPRQRTLSLSERSRLDPFVVATGDASPRDQRDLMERPFFSLAKTKRTSPIHYESGDVRVEVFAVPEHGMATIWDADILIWAASQIVEAANLAHGAGLEVHAGHGLTFLNVQPVAAIPEIAELNIGHFLIGEAVFMGLAESVKEMKRLMQDARTGRLY